MFNQLFDNLGDARVVPSIEGDLFLVCAGETDNALLFPLGPVNRDNVGVVERLGTNACPAQTLLIRTKLPRRPKGDHTKGQKPENKGDPCLYKLRCEVWFRVDRLFEEVCQVFGLRLTRGRVVCQFLGQL